MAIGLPISSLSTLTTFLHNSTEVLPLPFPLSPFQHTHARSSKDDARHAPRRWCIRFLSLAERSQCEAGLIGAVAVPQRLLLLGQDLI